jgi:putative inorganic carbon (hco3(-)) transporter
VSRVHFVTELFGHPDFYSVVVLVSLGVVLFAAAYLLSRVNVTVLLIVAIFLQMFSGNWSNMGIPLPLDRLTLAVAISALALKGSRNVSAMRLVLRPLHLAMLSAATWCAVSGIIAGTLTGHLGFYAYLDRFGLVPFIVFCLSPIFFGTPGQRRILLAGLIAIGLYLGFTGTMEGLHIYKLIFPRYIVNPNLGIQFGRARGPILESTGDGFCTFVGMVAAAIGLRTWQSARARCLCLITIALGGATLFFTLTRSVWIGGFIGIIGAMILTKQTRRILAPLMLVGIVAVVGTLAVSSRIRAEALGRTESESPVWDRQNTDIAALRIISEHPLTGIGWENFIIVSPNYMIQQATYPISGEGIEVHNVFLSHAAELGIPGLLLWLLAFGGAVRRGFFPGRFRLPSKADKDGPDPDLVNWRLGGVAILLCFLSVADLAPFSEALPNTLLWLWFGVMAAPYTSRLRTAALHRHRVPAALPVTSRITQPDPRPVFL